MWREILQQDIPRDYVIATGLLLILRIFVIMAFAEVGISLTFEGNKKTENG
jgi:GDPmannose 4,6-dehydratase